jgi:hypothetical protein
MSSIKQINFSKRTFLPKVRVNGDCDKGRGLDYYKHFKCNEKNINTIYYVILIYLTSLGFHKEKRIDFVKQGWSFFRSKQRQLTLICMLKLFANLLCDFCDVRVNGDCDKGRGLDYYKHFKCNEKLADQTSILKTDGEKTIDTRYIRPLRHLCSISMVLKLCSFMLLLT